MTTRLTPNLPCKQCGGIERYAGNNRCVACCRAMAERSRSDPYSPPKLTEMEIERKMSGVNYGDA